VQLRRIEHREANLQAAQEGGKLVERGSAGGQDPGVRVDRFRSLAAGAIDRAVRD
jgi:hypothetical protein